MKITTIRNEFTGYFAEVKTIRMPAISTIKKHLRASKARDCQSTTIVEVDGVRHDILDNQLTPY